MTDPSAFALALNAIPTGPLPPVRFFNGDVLGERSLCGINEAQDQVRSATRRTGDDHGNRSGRVGLGGCFRTARANTEPTTRERSKRAIRAFFMVYLFVYCVIRINGEIPIFEPRK